MTQQTENGIIDLFRERLASPFIFTYFWVSCTWNWKAIYWFIYEPLKPSLKLQNIPFKWDIFIPLFIAIAIVVFVPWINNFVEFLKRFAENKYNQWLHKHGWKEMISSEEHSIAIEEIANLKSKVYELANNNEDVKKKENELKIELIQEKEKLSNSLTEIGIYQDKANKLKETLSASENDISRIKLENSQLSNKLQNETKTVKLNNVILEGLNVKNAELSSIITMLTEKKSYLDESISNVDELNRLLQTDSVQNSNINLILLHTLRVRAEEIQTMLTTLKKSYEKL